MLFLQLQTIGLAALRLSESAILPLNITQYSLELSSYLTRFEDIAKSAGVTGVNFTKTAHVISNIQAAAHQLDVEIKDVTSALETSMATQPSDLKAAKKTQKRLMRKLRSINLRKMAFERGFIAKEGLPRRQWYKHLGVAPGENLGVRDDLCHSHALLQWLIMLIPIVRGHYLPRTVSRRSRIF